MGSTECYSETLPIVKSGEKITRHGSVEQRKWFLSSPLLSNFWLYQPSNGRRKIPFDGGNLDILNLGVEQKYTRQFYTLC